MLVRRLADAPVEEWHRLRSHVLMDAGELGARNIRSPGSRSRPGGSRRCAPTRRPSRSTSSSAARARCRSRGHPAGQRRRPDPGLAGDRPLDLERRRQRAGLYLGPVAAGRGRRAPGGPDGRGRRLRRRRGRLGSRGSLACCPNVRSARHARARRAARVRHARPEQSAARWSTERSRSPCSWSARGRSGPATEGGPPTRRGRGLRRRRRGRRRTGRGDPASRRRAGRRRRRHRRGAAPGVYRLPAGRPGHRRGRRGPEAPPGTRGWKGSTWRRGSPTASRSWCPAHARRRRSRVPPPKTARSASAADRRATGKDRRHRPGDGGRHRRIPRRDGGLASVDQLDQVPGIGPATMEALRARLQP